MPKIDTAYQNRQPDGSWVCQEKYTKEYDDKEFAYAVAKNMAERAASDSGGKITVRKEASMTIWTVAYGYKGDTEYVVVVRS